MTTSVFGAICPSVADTVAAWNINGIDMHRRAFNMLTPVPALYPPDVRGENVAISGQPGQTAYPLEVEQTDIIVPMLVSGLYLYDDSIDPGGHFSALRRNFRYLRANIFGPVDGATATYDAFIDWVGGAVDYAAVQVIDIGEVYADVELVKTNVTLRLPLGEFTELEAS